MLATAVGQALTKHLHDLLELMFACGLTEPLRQALVDLAHNIPPLLPVIQERLLNLLSIILSGQNFRAPGSPERVNSNLVPSIANQQPADGKDSELITLALNTLGGFDFTGNVLNEFVRDVMINYVEDDNPEVRKAAALSSCQLFIKDPIVFQTSNHAIQVVSQVLEKLLTVGITDPDPTIRLLVLSALDEKFDRHLAQSRNIRTLFIALNDEVFQIREVAISIIGRLTAYNPGHVMPSLRKTLIQLLTELEYSTVNRNKEEAARLLGLLISNAKTLVKPYVEPVLKVLLPKAHDSNAGVASSILACIGELAKVGGEDLYPYIKGLMPLILETLQDQSSSVKRDTSLRTLGELASNSGYVIQPYLDFPNLFELFIGILKSEQSAPTRRETVKVMGILGALDPYKYQTADKADKVAGTADQKDAAVDISMLMIGLGNTEEYYPTVVMGSLMMILKDPSLNSHHTAVIQAIMSMYKALGLKCVSFLPEVHCLNKRRLIVGDSGIPRRHAKLSPNDSGILLPTARNSSRHRQTTYPQFHARYSQSHPRLLANSSKPPNHHSPPGRSYGSSSRRRIQTFPPYINTSHVANLRSGYVGRTTDYSSGSADVGDVWSKYRGVHAFGVASYRRHGREE